MKKLGFLFLALILVVGLGAKEAEHRDEEDGRAPAQAAKTPTPEPTAKKTVVKSRDDGQDDEENASDDGEQELVIKVDRCSLKKGASGDDDDEDEGAEKGQRFVLKDKKLYNGYYKVEQNGRTRYVKASDCEAVKKGAALPTATPVAKKTEVKVTPKPMATEHGEEGDDDEHPATTPTKVPTPKPTLKPTAIPTEEPEEEATEPPTLVPTKAPTPKPTLKPTEVPTEEATEEATEEPTAVPTKVPTPKPTLKPTEIPTEEPTEAPTEVPTEIPTKVPTKAPTPKPTLKPTEVPTVEPTEEPTEVLTAAPTKAPTPKPTLRPTELPTEEPTEEPTEIPTAVPTKVPTKAPTSTPVPTRAPTARPAPVYVPSPVPTVAPSVGRGHRREKHSEPIGRARDEREARRSSGAGQIIFDTRQAVVSSLPSRDPQMLPSAWIYMPLGTGKNLGSVKPAFKPDASSADIRNIESSAFLGLGLEVRLPAPWLRVSGDWVYFTHRTKAADQNKVASKVDMPAPGTVVFDESDVYYQVNTHAFRLGLKASLPNRFIEPWINGTLGMYVWSAEYLDGTREWTYNGDSGVAFGGTVGTGVDFHFAMAHSVLTLTPFLEWGAPVVKPHVIDVAALGQSWDDTYGTPVAPQSRFGLQLAIGY